MALSTIFNIKAEEKRPVSLLLVQSFFLGIFISYFFSYANGAFLSTFPLHFLPYSYIVSGVMGSIVFTVFARLQERINYTRLLTASLSLVLALILIFWIGHLVWGANKWLVFMIFSWFMPISALVALQFWGMTMKLFDLRQGKRLFSLIASGDVISGLIGFWSVPLLLNFMNDSADLLLFAIIGMVMAIVFQLAIIRHFRTQLNNRSKSKGKTANTRKVKSRLSDLFKNKYFSLIFFLSILSMTGLIFVDYAFLGISRETFQEKILLTKFIGFFFGLIKAVELLAKTVVAGKLLDKYGLTAGLMVLPGLLLIFTIVALITGNLEGSPMLFFIPLAMNMLFLIVVKKSMEDPAFKMLYQPLDTEAKMKLQAQTEGKARQLAVIGAGVVLVLFNLIPSFSILHAIYILTLVLAAWLFVTYKTRSEYRSIINQRLSGFSNKTTVGLSHIYTNAFTFREGLDSKDSDTVLRAFRLLKRTEPGSTLRYAGQLLRHRDTAVRKAILTELENSLPIHMEKELKNAAKREEDKHLKTRLQALCLGLNELLSTPKKSIGEWANSEQVEERMKAAALCSRHKGMEQAQVLAKLLRDKEARVLQTAAANLSEHTAYVASLLIEDLENPRLSPMAFGILARADEATVPLLEDAFKQENKAALFHEKIVNLLGIIGGKQGLQFLFEQVQQSNSSLRHRILSILQQSHFRVDKKRYLSYKQLIEEETGHYSWLIASIHDLQGEENCKELVGLLHADREHTREKLFLLLSFYYESDAIEQIKKNLGSKQRENQVLAIEMADILLEEDIKELMFPVFDNVSLPEKIHRLNKWFPQQKLSVPERLRNISCHEPARVQNGIKVQAITRLNSYTDTIPNEVAANTYNKNRTLKEVSLITIYQSNPDLYQHYISREKEKDRLYFNAIVGADTSGIPLLTLMEKVQLIKHTAVFEKLPEVLLTQMAMDAESIHLDINTSFTIDRRKKARVYLLAQGQASITCPDGVSTNLEKGALIGLVEEKNWADAVFSSEEPAILLSMDAGHFFEWVQVYPELAQALFHAYITPPAEEVSAPEEVILVEGI